MDRNKQEKVIIALKEKGATQPCPRCRNLEFEIIGEGMIAISREGSDRWTSVFQPINPEVPVILISCKNCGYIAHHASGVLGLAR
jgi:predicted nucleic-acid-binding Zn-ribbon protein